MRAAFSQTPLGAGNCFKQSGLALTWIDGSQEGLQHLAAVYSCRSRRAVKMGLVSVGQALRLSAAVIAGLNVLGFTATAITKSHKLTDLTVRPCLSAAFNCSDHEPCVLGHLLVTSLRHTFVCRLTSVSSPGQWHEVLLLLLMNYVAASNSCLQIHELTTFMMALRALLPAAAALNILAITTLDVTHTGTIHMYLRYAGHFCLHRLSMGHALLGLQSNRCSTASANKGPADDSSCDAVGLSPSWLPLLSCAGCRGGCTPASGAAHVQACL